MKVRRWWRERLGDDRGAAMVEAALITPFFLTLLIGIMEGGLMFRSYLSLSNAVSNAGRTAAVAAAAPSADYRVLQRLKNDVAILGEGTVERIVVFRASGPGDEPSEACRAGIPSAVVGDECNVYVPNDWNRPKSQFGCVSAGALDSFWCPTSRSTSASNLDTVGVWVASRHTMATGVFGDSVSLADQTIVNVEPEGR